MEFLVYYEDAEYARDHNDPCLGTVRGETREEATQKAAACDFEHRTMAPLVGGLGFRLVEVRSESFLSEDLES